MDFPELEKLKVIQEKSQAAGEFYHWAIHKGYIKQRMFLNLDKILAEFFEIDLEKIDNEKRQILEELRRANEKEREKCKT